MSLMPVDPTNEIAVTSYLQQAKDWLSRAVDETGPEQIAAAKAEIATAAEATKQLGLSKEIRLDAVEMVRRAEYALAKAIRKGQEEGTVMTPGGMENRSNRTAYGLKSPSDFASDVELYDRPTQRKAGILSIADAATQEQFDAALEEAKAEGNLSRANVARKVKGDEAGVGLKKLPAERRAEQIAELAARGYTSLQISSEIGLSAVRVRAIARDHDVAIRADEVRGPRARRIDYDRMLDNVTESLEVAAIALRDIEPDQLDKEEAAERLDSLTTSIKALTKAVQKIKESFRD
jgi:hypothetical protein